MEQWIAVATGIITILGAIIAVTIYITRIQSQVREEQLIEENKCLKQQYNELCQQLTAALEVGSTALIIKREIDTQISMAKHYLNVAACSILVPFPGRSELVFLSIDSEKAEDIKKTPVPFDEGIAGYVFTYGKPYFSNNVHEDRRFFNKVDQRSGFKTKSLLCFPLKVQERTIGVIQFLNRKGDIPFNEGDVVAADRLASSLSPKVADFISNPKNFEIEF